MKWSEEKWKITQLCSTLYKSLWTVAHRVPLSMEFSRQEYCTGLPFPSPMGIPNPRTEPESPALPADSFPFEPPGNVMMVKWSLYILIFQYCYMMFLLLNMLSRLVITFLPRSKPLLISWLQSPSAVILEPPKIKSTLFPLFPHLFPMKWWDQMSWHDLSFLNVEL